MNCADIDIITASFAPDGGDGEDPTLLLFFLSSRHCWYWADSFLSVRLDVEINATGFNYQNEDEKVTLSFPSALQKGKDGLCLSWFWVLIGCRRTAPWTNSGALSVLTSTGSGTLKIDFVGELNDKMKGFYRSKYTTAAGETRYAAVTQFEVSGCGKDFSSSAASTCWGWLIHRKGNLTSADEPKLIRRMRKCVSFVGSELLTNKLLSLPLGRLLILF